MQNQWNRQRVLALVSALLLSLGWLSLAALDVRAQEGSIYLPVVVSGSASGGGDNGSGGSTSPTGQAAAGGGGHSVAVLADGTVRAAGYNPNGQLGDGNTNRQRSGAWLQSSGLTDVVAVGAGDDHSHAIKSDGTLWGWGQNNQGQLGRRHGRARQPESLAGAGTGHKQRCGGGSGIAILAGAQKRR